MHFSLRRPLQLTPAGLFFNDDASEFAYHMTLLRNESKIMLYDKKMLDRYPAKDEENSCEVSR